MQGKAILAAQAANEEVAVQRRSYYTEERATIVEKVEIPSRWARNGPNNDSARDKVHTDLAARFKGIVHWHWWRDPAATAWVVKLHGAGRGKEYALVTSKQVFDTWPNVEAALAARKASQRAEQQLRGTLWEAYDKAAVQIMGDLRLPVRTDHSADYRAGNRPPSQLTFNVSTLLDACQRVCSGNGSEVPR